jgi:hexulose-6-phosphate isomerase
LLETAAVDTPALEDEVVDSLRAAAEVAARHGVVLGLEMEIAGSDYAALVARVGHPSVRAYYDVGNSTARGFDVDEDVTPLLPTLFAVHLKDRKKGGTSMPFGAGDARFDAFFRKTLSHGFRGDFVLQHYFDREPQTEAARTLAFVRGRLTQAERFIHTERRR